MRAGFLSHEIPMRFLIACYLYFHLHLLEGMILSTLILLEEMFQLKVSVYLEIRFLNALRSRSEPTGKRSIMILR